MSHRPASPYRRAVAVAPDPARRPTRALDADVLAAVLLTTPLFAAVVARAVAIGAAFDAGTTISAIACVLGPLMLAPHIRRIVSVSFRRGIRARHRRAKLTSGACDHMCGETRLR